MRGQHYHDGHFQPRADKVPLKRRDTAFGFSGSCMATQCSVRSNNNIEVYIFSTRHVVASP
jgi:hypothetical protein